LSGDPSAELVCHGSVQHDPRIERGPRGGDRPGRSGEAQLPPPAGGAVVEADRAGHVVDEQVREVRELARRGRGFRLRAGGHDGAHARAGRARRARRVQHGPPGDRGSIREAIDGEPADEEQVQRRQGRVGRHRSIIGK
jgi:hypothetical protein